MSRPPSGGPTCQANAVYALLAKLDEADYLAIAGVLTPEKQMLLTDLARAFMEDP